MNKTRFFCLPIFLFAAQICAHDLYIKTIPAVMKQPSKVFLDMYLADTFPGESVVWKHEKTVRFEMFGLQGIRKLNDRHQGRPSADAGKQGTFLFVWQGTPSYLELASAEFNKYLEKEKYDGVIGLRKTTQQQDTPGRERYSRYLKTLMQVGSIPTDHFSHQMNLRLEIVPLKNPFGLKLGDDLQVRVLFEGRPMKQHPVMATYNGYSNRPEDYAQTTKTDDQGVAHFKLSNDGFWMIRSTHMIPLEEDAQADWESFWANCTFEIPPPN